MLALQIAKSTATYTILHFLPLQIAKNTVIISLFAPHTLGCTPHVRLHPTGCSPHVRLHPVPLRFNNNKNVRLHPPRRNLKRAFQMGQSVNQLTNQSVRPEKTNSGLRPENTQSNKHTNKETTTTNQRTDYSTNKQKIKQTTEQTNTHKHGQTNHQRTRTQTNTQTNYMLTVKIILFRIKI